MKAKKDLVKYLADYTAKIIDTLHKMGLPVDFSKQGLKLIIGEGLALFELSENVKVEITDDT